MAIAYIPIQNTEKDSTIKTFINIFYQFIC